MLAYFEVVVVVNLEDAPYLPQRGAHRLSPLAVAALEDLSRERTMNVI